MVEVMQNRPPKFVYVSAYKKMQGHITQYHPAKKEDRLLPTLYEPKNVVRGSTILPNGKRDWTVFNDMKKAERARRAAAKARWAATRR